MTRDEAQLQLDARCTDAQRRCRAVDALLALGPGSIPIVVESFRTAGDLRWLVAERMVLHGASLAPVFRRLLHAESDFAMRVLCALALHALGEPEGEPVLLEAVRRGSEWELLAAARLTTAGSAQVREALLERLRTISPTREREVSIAGLLEFLIKNGESIPRDIRERFSEIPSPLYIAPLLGADGE